MAGENISKTEYQVLRSQPDFLYRYFKRAGGTDIGSNAFYSQLANWMVSKQVHPRQGQILITKFLDKKFAQ
jgi:hypothetical protein